MKRYNYTAAFLVIGVNLALFAVKLYVSLASFSLTVYCDAVNNFFDIFSGIIAFLGFYLGYRSLAVNKERAQSLATFIISVFIMLGGVFFIYRGLDRLMYPVKTSYTNKYVTLIAATVLVKIVLGAVLLVFNKKAPSGITRALATDSILDCGVTAFTLISIFVVSKINIAADAYFAFLCGGAITVSAVKNIVKETKLLIT